ncbi:MAG: NTP transferase domain-containing protein [Gammaproteobacteria bacterium]|nr:NTP transferase domain-containing protein [Gammaproteobacteria bacterium]MBT8110623.1 NTP transferase domain-containing protein [Gammaproteobacteria bacterium]NND46752.1 NTP transferase domain-containing protein [Woeseiaceae bacterium]NNL45323.1 NTP transferase domain-containing protein [Woeseiaceae bacterium]
MASRKAASPLYGLVLAGGKSRRMGRDKARLLRDGQSQLAYVVSVLDPLVDRVFVSTRADQQDEKERSRFDRIVDRYQDMGPVAGILSAMDEHPDADWLVVACDLPNIDASTVSYLLRHRSPDRPFAAYRSSHDDLPEPLCAVYTAGSADIVRGFVAEGIRCPRKILIRSDTQLLEQTDPNSLHNVNTPDDLQGSVFGANS